MASENTEEHDFPLKKRAMLTALESTLGVVTQAAKKVGITRRRHYQWMREDAKYREDVESIEDMALDYAESSLHNQIKNGNHTSTIFFLKTKGKKRGYIETIHNENVNHTIPSDMSQEEINAKRQELKRRLSGESADS